MKLFLLGFLISCNLWAQTVTVSYQGQPEQTESELRSVVYKMAIQKLIKEQMAAQNLDLVAYETAFEKKFSTWFAGIEAKRRVEWKDKPDLEALVAQEKLTSRESFAGLEKLLKRTTIKKFSPHPVELNQWEMVLEAEVDSRLLSLHHQRMLEDNKSFRKLFVRVQMDTQNFTWTDLKLKAASDFTSVVEAEWLKWFEANSPADVEEVVLCDATCRSSLEAWEVQDEKTMKSFVSPELVGNLLLTVNLSVEKDLIRSTASDTKMNHSGGVILHDLNTKRVLFWADLPKETQVIRASEQKNFNSLLASYVYKYPLSQLMDAKNQVARSVSLTNSMTVKVMGASHLGQVMQFLNWIRVKGAGIQAQGKLDSFSQNEAKILFFFRGSENKFKALVSGSSELESELGRPLAVTELGPELIITLGEKLKQ